MIRSFKFYFCHIFVIFILLSNSPVFGAENSGDINNDGGVDLADGVLVLPILSGQPTDGLDIDISADVNGDNHIGYQEAIFALQWGSELRGGQANSNASLSGLTFCCGTLTPAFDPQIPMYFSMVENPVSEVTVTATTADPNAAITVGGSAAISGEISDPVHVEMGYSPLHIVITAEDGITTQTYTINIYRRETEPGSNAYLSDLTLSEGTIAPVFHPDSLSYTANVPLDKEQVTITATTQEESALVMINGNLVASGTASLPISLTEGENDPIIVLVMAEDGSTTQIYEIIVTRGDIQELSTNAFLSGLTLSETSLNESFFPVLFNYSAIVASDVDSIRITPETDDPNATITINGAAVISGQPSLPIDLLEGENTLSIDVTAQDPGVTQTYDIIVTREGTGPSSNANLAGLMISETGLTPAFAPGILNYTANVLNYIEHITVTPTASNPSAGITANGIPVISGQASSQIDLLNGDNLIIVTVTAEDTLTTQTYTINVSRHGAPTGVAAMVYVVDAPASGAHEFETLTSALEYLTTNLTPDQLGEIRIQTTQPMAVDELNFACNIIITLDPGATTTIVGPGTHALSINAGGSLDISGLNFVNTAGFVINSSVGLSATGSQFSGDTLINVGSGGTSLSSRSATAIRSPAGTGFVSKDLSFNAGLINGGLNVSAAGATQKDIEVTNTKATFMDFSGTFTESSYVNLKANLIPELSINLDLRNDSRLDLSGHTGLNYTSSTINMEGNASAIFKSNTIAKFESEWKGLKGRVEFQNIFAGDASMIVSTKDFDFKGNTNNFNKFNMEISDTSEAGTIGINLDGLFVSTSLFLNAPGLPVEGSVTASLKNLKTNGAVDLLLSGKVTLTLDTVRIGAEATFKHSQGFCDFKAHKTEFIGKFYFQSLDKTYELNGSYSHIIFHNDAIWDIAGGNFIIRFGTIDDSSVEIDESHHIWIQGNSEGAGSLDTTTRSALDMAEGEIHIKNLNVKGSSGKPGLIIEGVDVPVTIENSQIKSDQWAIALRDVDGAVTIQNNSEITGGIFLDGDPDETGSIIDKQYTITGNTISHNYPGMSCIQTHAIRDVLIEDTDMTATGEGAHGVHVSGGKVIIRKGSIMTSGPEKSQAIGVGESVGGHNGIVYAEDLSLITGAVQTGPKGYIKLTGNTFSNAKVIDYKEDFVAYPRLLNDPMGDDNEGLNPDEDILGSLIDWNDDDHNCPDYPTKCDEWDEDEKKCGCGEDGVDPPTDPGV